jgi:cobalt-zinc-cadmium efflux system membrane fusion protein
MKRFAFILIAVSLILFGGEKHGEEHSAKIHLTEEAIEQLGIKLIRVEKKPAGRLIKMPAEVVENPNLSYSVFSPAEGIVRELFVSEGDRVKKGDRLARIYSPEIADLVGEIEMAKVRLKTAESIFKRDEELYRQKVIQYTRFFTSKTEYERALGELKALMGKLRSFGDVEGYHLILRSPGNGFVVSQLVRPGDSVGPDRKLFEIHSHELLWVYGWADEESASEIKKGQKGEVATAEGGLPCSIDYIGHEVDPKTRRVKVRCVAKNRKHILKPGMFVTLKVFTGGPTRILIPKSAIQEIEGKKTVFVRKGEGFEARQIHVAKEIDGFAVVEEGLREGEKIAVSGTVFLKTKLVGVEEGGHAH